MSNVVMACALCKKEHVFVDFVPFRDECEACSADLHICLGCRFYDRYASDECRETSADAVAVKDRRNLCEYFKPLQMDAASNEPNEIKKDPLAALFGKEKTTLKESCDPLASLFQKKEVKTEP